MYGPDEMGDTLPFVDLGDGMDGMVAAISMRYTHICALSTEGRVKCWGANSDGCLGGVNDSFTEIGATPGQMGNNLPFVDLGTNRTARMISAGWSFTCAVLDTYELKCWGANGDGQLGVETTDLAVGTDPSQMGDALLPVLFPGNVGIQQVATGSQHTCVISVTSDLYCFGSNFEGMLGLGITDGSWGSAADEMGENLPMVDVGGTPWKIYASDSNTCVILTDGSVKCWGEGAFGMLGTGETNAVGYVPDDMGVNLPMVDLGDVAALSLSMSYADVCVLLVDHTLKCWGGDVPVPGDDVYGFGNRTNKIMAIQSALTVHIQCASWDDAPEPTMMCWGNNDFGNLGIGSVDTVVMEAGGPGNDTTPADIFLYTYPTSSPTPPTASPTSLPTVSPTHRPTQTPTSLPTAALAPTPTAKPTKKSSNAHMVTASGTTTYLLGFVILLAVYQ